MAGATETMKGVAKQGYANVASEVATVTVKGFAKLKGIAHVERKKGLREADLVDDEMVHHVNAVDGADPRVLNRSGPEKKSWMACPDGQIPSKPMRLIKWEKIFYQARRCKPCTHTCMLCSLCSRRASVSPSHCARRPPLP